MRWDGPTCGDGASPGEKFTSCCTGCSWHDAPTTTRLPETLTPQDASRDTSPVAMPTERRPSPATRSLGRSDGVRGGRRPRAGSASVRVSAVCLARCGRHLSAQPTALAASSDSNVSGLLSASLGALGQVAAPAPRHRGRYWPGCPLVPHRHEGHASQRLGECRRGRFPSAALLLCGPATGWSSAVYLPPSPSAADVHPHRLFGKHQGRQAFGERPGLRFRTRHVLHAAAAVHTMHARRVYALLGQRVWQLPLRDE